MIMYPLAIDKVDNKLIIFADTSTVNIAVFSQWLQIQIVGFTLSADLWQLIVCYLKPFLNREAKYSNSWFNNGL